MAKYKVIRLSDKRVIKKNLCKSAAIFMAGELTQDTGQKYGVTEQ